MVSEKRTAHFKPLQNKKRFLITISFFKKTTILKTSLMTEFNDSSFQFFFQVDKFMNDYTYFVFLFCFLIET